MYVIVVSNVSLEACCFLFITQFNNVENVISCSVFIKHGYRILCNLSNITISPASQHRAVCIFLRVGVARMDHSMTA